MFSQAHTRGLYWNKTGNVRIKRNIEPLSRSHCCRGKAISITYSECVFVTLVIQHAMRMRRIILWPVWLYHIFTQYLINGTILGKKLLNIKCVF
jgi:hypothetical protein